jgi:diguanylate cyclase (GGDEF)-like protein/PAS domain S-box-containing protein
MDATDGHGIFIWGGASLLAVLALGIAWVNKLYRQFRFREILFKYSHDAVLVANPAGTIVAVNGAFTEITGYQADEVVGRNPRVLKSQFHDGTFYAAMWAALKKDGEWQGEVMNRRKNGEVYVAHQHIMAVRDLFNRLQGYVAIQRDITDERRYREAAQHHTNTDPVTGLPNRILAMDRLEHALSVSRANGDKVALFMLDIDNFKTINESLGHHKGDLLLSHAARVIAKAAGPASTVARLGGDEFAIILEGELLDSALSHMAETLLRDFGVPLTGELGGLRISVSIGIAVSPDDGIDCISLMKSADAAVYSVKKDGRNGYCFFNASMTANVEQRLMLEMDLRRAIENQEFELFYQPKIDLSDMSLNGVEALIRWRHPQRGLVSPLQFIPLAEETGLIAPIGEWAFEQACRQIAEWKGLGRPVTKIAVNLSARQFADPQLSVRLAKYVVSYDVNPGDLEIEVTEGAVMADPEQAIETIKAFRSLGLSVSIDDFGTGYSSLAYLKRLPVNIIKIDRAFVNDIGEGRTDAEIAKAIISLGAALGVKIVAEGVETKEQVDILRRFNCTLAQGYFFGKPMPVAEFEQWRAAFVQPQQFAIRA